MGSIRKNFGYNIILTGSKYVFPLIVFPYITRVLGVSNIGICDYVDSIIQYFVLFSMLGIESLGVREIARCKDDVNKRSQVFSNLTTLNLLLTILGIGILCFCTQYVEKFQPYRPFLYVGVFKLLFQVFVVDWFFQGLQNFRYITLRSVAIRCMYVISIFLFVRSSEDTLVYYALTTGITVLNAVCNWTYSRKFCKFSLKKIDFRLFIVPVLVFGYYRILTSLYTTFNTLYLGFVHGDTQVGYFSTAAKMNTLIMSVISALTTVLVPKVAQLVADGDHTELKRIADTTFSLITICSIPVIVYCVTFAPEIIRLLAGPGFEGAYTPFRIIIFLVLIIGLEQIIIQQFLMASADTRNIAIVSTVGAIVGISLNFILTPGYASIGSAISWGCSELAVLITGSILLYRKMKIGVSPRELSVSILLGSLYIIPSVLIKTICNNSLFALILGLIAVIAVFFLNNLGIHRNELLASTLNNIKKRISGR